ncbi:relaxase/mobilization nuclease domain-containing protein [Dysgonomonas sp. GY75]|uniref:conjugal transfer protein MobB n=1 Tax=Dysgonomonas sp. GY75 TaxID=2780419 RepID=UPI001883281D|nr:conjugal transfer protein MobB [Dysgonomonas sp. GY75]MBF0647406.1 relaxase/mobilization nuclease domain-containing protein [Dysgonomonas sp. GY75]
MIAKIIHGSSLYGVVSYNQQKVDGGVAEVIHSHKMIVARDDQPDAGLGKTLQSFEPYLAANPRIKKHAVHISINPDRGDPTDAETLRRISEDYLQQLGYGGQPYIIYRHTDIDRVHVHIVTVNIDGDGGRISDRYEKLRSMDISRALEKKYGLKQLSGEHDEASRLYLHKVDYRKGDVRRQISNTVKSVLDMYGFRTLGEYNALLSLFNIHVKHVRGEEEGRLYNGIIYCAMDDKGEPAGNPIKSSRIGKAVGYEALLKQIRKTEGQVKSGQAGPLRSKSVIRDAMLHNGGSKKLFTEALGLRGIDVVFRENEQERIYGVTFIDHNSRLAFNGSRLGKEFSANAFQQLFHEGAVPAGGRKPELSIPQAETGISPSIGSPVAVDEIFGTFYLDNSGSDPQEEAFMRRLRRKKKKGMKRRL